MDLLDREQKTLSDIVAHYRGIMMSATQEVSNRSDIGRAAYNSMQMDLEVKGLIKSTEDLLTLTRQLRELWVVGPLQKAGQGERDAEGRIEGDVQATAALLQGFREERRRRTLGRYGKYVAGPIRQPIFEGAGVGGSGAGPSNGGAVSAAAAVAGAAGGQQQPQQPQQQQRQQQSQQQQQQQQQRQG